MFPLVVQMLKLVLKRNAVTTQTAITLGRFFKQISDIVSGEMIEQALQRCYLDADSIEAARMETVAANFNEVVKSLANLQLIQHVPSRKPAEESDGQAEKAAEPEKQEKQEKQEEAKTEEQPIKDEAKFLELLQSHTLGQELWDLVENAGLENDTRLKGGAR